jgi:hypothetical protein
MAFELKATPAAKGGDGISFTLSEKVIKSVMYKTDTPDDDNSRSNDVTSILVVKGDLLQDEEEDTKKMAQWSLESKLPYKNVVVKHTAGSVVIREYKLTSAFVVDYIEEFSEDKGDGAFTLIIKQKKDKIDEVEIEGGYGA